MILPRTLNVARHEAAHAVATELLGGRVAEVRLLRRPLKAGKLGVLQAYSRRDGRARLTPLAAAVVSVVGSSYECGVAPRKNRRKPIGSIDGGDARQLKSAKVCSFDIGLLDHLARCWARQPLVRRCIEAVARALLKKDLKGGDVRAIMQREVRRAARRHNG